jgi:formylglycine-generating enzyme required for sulfatase activity
VALPNPIPDNPIKWTGWKDYNSPNPYDRLCLSYSSNATAEMIEEHCRQLLVWWQKKLPLKNQPSNPMAQLLRQGLDEAPHYLAEARSKLLDPEQRKIIDSELHAQVVGRAIEEFKKLLGFTLADKRLTKESEAKLYVAGEQLGLTREDIDSVIAAEMEATGASRVVDEPPPAPAPAPNGGTPAALPASGGNPFDEFRRILKMSRLCLEGEEMSDDQRDAMCNLGESLGLTGGQAEDLIDEYLEEMASMPLAPSPKPGVVAPGRPASVPAPARPQNAVAVASPPKPAPAGQPAPRPPVASPAPAAPVQKAPEKAFTITPAARAAERQKYPNFVNSVGASMFLLPSGRFIMGSDAKAAHPSEQPLTPVTLSCFYISRFPITNAQYEAFAPSHASKRAPWADQNHPVVYVTWNDADAFCKWLSRKEGKIYRLPTEAEWEYAARGDDDRVFPWGQWNPAIQVANFADASTTFPWRDPSINDGYPESSPVGSFPRGASPFGVEDLAGNVYEWCLDWYEPYKGREVMNPRPGTGGRQRVCRGGSWKSRISSLRTTARAFNEPGYFSNDFGFRIVCECV